MGRIARKPVMLLRLLLPLILPLVLIALLSIAVNRAVTYVLIWLIWLPRGKDVLLVSSDSPTWQRYMAEEILPLVKQRAIVLNWSGAQPMALVALLRPCVQDFLRQQGVQPDGLGLPPS
jgi:hypothetical protein